MPIEDALLPMQRSISGGSHMPPEHVTVVQDPSPRTIETLYREISGLESVMTLLFASQREVADEKSKSVRREFELVERQRIEQKNDTAVGVAAALTAQKEAVREQTTASSLAINKSESATAEQARQSAANFTTALQGLTELLNDSKTQHSKLEIRVNSIEVGKTAIVENKVQQHSSNANWTAIATVAFAAVMVVLSRIPVG